MANEDRNKRKPGAVLSLDTSPEVESIRIELWRRLKPHEKARAVSESSRAVQELSLLGIRRRHPGASDSECMMHFAILSLGRELAEEVYPEIASLTGG